jgi:protein-S-isoprenylcysteine O-methyltransferase Ste14
MSPFLRTAVFTMLVPGFWTVAVPFWLLPNGVRPAPGAAAALGWLFMAAGAALYFVCAFWGFAARGQGTPAPIDPPKKLVIEGPYDVVRNPMYWSVALVMFGEAFVFHFAVFAGVAAGFFLGVNVFVLLYEEPTLQRKFGIEYEEYCQRVPRWLPRVRS